MGLQDSDYFSNSLPVVLQKIKCIDQNNEMFPEDEYAVLKEERAPYKNNPELLFENIFRLVIIKLFLL